MPSVYIGLLQNLFNILFNFLFIHWLGWGFNGSPLATSASRVISFIMIAVYYKYMRRVEGRHQGGEYKPLVEEEEERGGGGGGGGGEEEGDEHMPAEILDGGGGSGGSTTTSATAVGVGNDENKLPFWQAFRK